jgi:hypothetical protein
MSASGAFRRAFVAAVVPAATAPMTRMRSGMPGPGSVVVGSAGVGSAAAVRSGVSWATASSVMVASCGLLMPA